MSAEQQNIIAASSAQEQQAKNELLAKIEATKAQEGVKAHNDLVEGERARLALQNEIAKDNKAQIEGTGMEAHVRAAIEIAAQSIAGACENTVQRTADVVETFVNTANVAADETNKAAHAGWEQTKETAAAAKDTTKEAIVDTSSAAWEKTKAAAEVTKEATVSAAHKTSDAISHGAAVAWEKTKESAASLNDLANGNRHLDAAESAAAEHDAADAKIALEAAIERERAENSIPLSEAPLSQKLKVTTIAAAESVVHGAATLVEKALDGAAALKHRLLDDEIDIAKASKAQFAGRFDTITPEVHVTSK